MKRVLTVVAAVLAMSAASLVAQQAKPKKAQRSPDAVTSLNQKLAIEGPPSSLVGCAGGTFYNTHALGASVRGTRIRIDIEGDDTFDGVATAVVLQMGAAAPNANTRVSFVTSDDGDGLDPRLDFTLEHDANVVLNVGSFDGDFGCYFVKVDVRLP